MRHSFVSLVKEGGCAKLVITNVKHCVSHGMICVKVIQRYVALLRLKIVFLLEYIVYSVPHHPRGGIECVRAYHLLDSTHSSIM